MIKVTNSEEYKGETTLFLSNGHEVKFATSKLIEFIEDNHLNVRTEDDGHGGDHEVTFATADEFLDTEWESVCAGYYKHVILKGE